LAIEHGKNFERAVVQVVHNSKSKTRNTGIISKKWDCWVLPGGKIESGETPEEAAKREAFEETNLVIEDLKVVAEQIFSNDQINKKSVGYLLESSKYSGEIKIKEPQKIERIEFKKIDYEFAVNRLFFKIRIDD